MTDNYFFDGLKSVHFSSLASWGDLLDLESETGELSVLSAYQRVAYLYRAVDIRARALAGVPWSLVRSRGSADVQDDPQYRGLVRGLRERLYLTESALCLFGAAYWLKETNQFGRNPSLRWVLPSSITVRVDPREGLAGFMRSWGGGTQDLAIEQVVFFWVPSLSTEVGPGEAPAIRALAAARVLHNLDLFAAHFFQRGAIKATLLSVEGNPPREELARLESWWKRLVSGARNAWQSVAIRSTVHPVVIGEGLSELGDRDLVAQQREDVCAAMGVPHSLLSADAATYATANQDYLNLYEQTVVPECRLVAETMNVQVFDGLGLRFAFHPERLEVYQRREMEKAAAVAELVGQPVLTVDEGRAMLGYGAVERSGA